MTSIDSPAQLRDRWRLATLAVTGAALSLAVLLHGRIAQEPGYHDFADQRAVLGVPNFWNVASNIALVLAGIAGLIALRGGSRETLPRLRAAYTVLFAGTILTGIGSTFYHLQPDNHRLVFDRLPMTIAFMAFTAIVAGEHLSEQLARRALPLLLSLGFGSVFYWFVTDLRGHDDLRPYFAVQFVPIAVIPLVLLLFPSRVNRGRFHWALLAGYASAKTFELLDHSIFRWSDGLVSGHTLKHVAAAAAVYSLVLAAKPRKTQDRPQTG